VKVYAGKNVMVRQVQAAGGYLSQSSRTVHFGLGDRSRIDRVEIRWPSGQRQTLDAPPLNRRHDIIEPARLGRRRFRFLFANAFAGNRRPAAPHRENRYPAPRRSFQSA